MVNNAKTEKFIVAVDLLSAAEIGKVITVSHPDYEGDEEGTIESSGILYTLHRFVNKNGMMTKMKFSLGGPDASTRNNTFFVLTAAEAMSGDYKFRASDW